MLALAWLPGQARAGALRGWLAWAVIPLLVACALPAAGGARRARLGPVLPWLLLALLGLAGACWSPDPGAALATVCVQLGWAAAATLGLLAHGRSRDPAPWPALAGAAAALPGLLQEGGTFGNPDLLAGFLVGTTLWSLHQVRTAWPGATPTAGAHGSAQSRLPGLTALVAALLLQLAALARCGSLGCWLALAGGIWAWGATRLLGARARRPGGRAAAGRSLALLLAPALLGALLLLEPGVRDHLAGRLHMAQVTAAVAWRSLPWGQGPGQLHAAFLEEQARLLQQRPAAAARWTNATHAHNELLHAVAEQGPLGLLLLLWPLLLALRTVRDHPAWACVVAYSLLGLVSLPLYEPATATLGCFSLGWLLASREKAREATARERACGDDSQGVFTRAGTDAGLPGVVARPVALALALPALLLGSADLLGDRLLARGATKRSPQLLDLAAFFSLRQSRPLLHQADVLVEGDPYRAWILAERAMSLDPSPRGHLLLGRAALRIGEPARAIPPLQQAVRLHPRLFAGHFNLARAYEEAGDRFNARRHATRARSLRPGDPRLRWLPR